MGLFLLASVCVGTTFAEVPDVTCTGPDVIEWEAMFDGEVSKRTCVLPENEGDFWSHRCSFTEGNEEGLPICAQGCKRMCQKNIDCNYWTGTSTSGCMLFQECTRSEEDNLGTTNGLRTWVKVCATDPPTDAPVELPTANPTDPPTDDPTAAPTANPTEPPVELPTANPTDPPTDDPTAAPTANPTNPPTDGSVTPKPTPDRPDRYGSDKRHKFQKTNLSGPYSVITPFQRCNVVRVEVTRKHGRKKMDALRFEDKAAASEACLVNEFCDAVLDNSCNNRGNGWFMCDNRRPFQTTAKWFRHHRKSCIYMLPLEEE